MRLLFFYLLLACVLISFTYFIGLEFEIATKIFKSLNSSIDILVLYKFVFVTSLIFLSKYPVSDTSKKNLSYVSLLSVAFFLAVIFIQIVNNGFHFGSLFPFFGGLGIVVLVYAIHIKSLKSYNRITDDIYSFYDIEDKTTLDFINTYLPILSLIIVFIISHWLTK